MFKIFQLLDQSYKKNFYFLVFLMFLSSVLEIINVSLIIPIIYSLLDSKLYNKYFFIKYFDQFPFFFIENKLYLFLILFVIFFLLKNFFLLYYNSQEGKFIYNNQESISKRLLKFYLYKNYSFHVKNNSADFINKISKESNQFSNALNSYVVFISEMFLLLSVSFFILLLFLKEFIIIIFSIIFFSLILFFLFSKTIKKIGQSRMHYEYLRTKNLQEIFGAIKEIKFNKNELFFLNKYSFISDYLSKLYSNWHFLGRLPKIYYETLILILVSSFLFVMTLSERSAIDIIAILGTFIAVAFRIVPSANKIVSSINTFRYSKAAIDSLYYLFRENFDSYKEKKNINVKKSFSLKNLYFKYLSKENYIFQNINFEIRNGDHICIYGDSGIGKSSLIDIILGLKEPVKGDIFIDDKKVDIEKYSWSSSMSFVPQDIYLLDQSIVENIALGVDKKFIDYNLIYKSLKISKLDEFVDLLPNKLNTITGEKGIQLSGGQKQRLGIARAIYRDSKILILDEATNALDSQLEEDLIKSLLLEYKEKTVIMITHKLNIISYFSRKIKIQDMVLIEKK
jgi:ABC-type multidrug transport system fused ATPase/permease subunit